MIGIMNDLKDKKQTEMEEFKHKLNTYISSIWGYLQMAQKKEDIEELKKLIDSAEKECRKLVDFVEKQN